MNWQLLDRLGNVAIILLAACAVVFTVTHHGRLIGAVDDHHSASLPPPYRVGDRVATLERVDYGASDHTLLIVIQTGCGFCTDSLPFYRRLITDRDARRANVRIIAVVPESDTSAPTYLDSEGVRPDGLAFFRKGGLRIQGTPTLLFLDRFGTLSAKWEGQLSQSGQTQLLNAVLGSGDHTRQSSLATHD